MTPDEIIEVLQGFKSGRGWQFLSRSNEWKTPILSSLESMLHALYSQQTIRLAPLPDEITIPARVIPAPLREAPELSHIYFLANPLTAEAYQREVWRDDDIDRRALARGLAFASSEDAEKAGKAMCTYA